MRGIKALLLGAAIMIVPLALASAGNTQISINIGGPPPVCPYGYTTMHPIPARSTGITDPRISITVFSWGLARGITGVIGMDGIAIASMVLVEDVIGLAAADRAVAVPMAWIARQWRVSQRRRTSLSGSC